MVEVFGVSVSNEITNSAELRKYRKMPSKYVKNKAIDHIDSLSERFIAASSMVLLATRRPDGGIDQTPRGDPAGFVKLINRKVLALPDRLGNNRADAFENILDDPGVGLIFLIPGHRETLRVSGRAKIVSDEKISKMMEVNGHMPDLVILVEVEHVMSHCPKAFVRGKVWEFKEWPDRSNVPSAGEFLVTHGKLNEAISDVNEVVDRDRENRLY